MENTSTKDLVFSIVGLIVIFGGLYLFFRVFDVDTVRAYIENAGVWAPLILVAAKASTIIFVPLSGSPLYPIGGALFGFWKAFFLLFTGDMIGGAVAFFISRYFGRALALRLIGSQTNLVSQALTMMGTVRGFLLARLCFISFPEIPAYAGGLSKIPFLPFILIYSIIGAIPTALVTGLGSLLTGENNSLIFSGVFVAGAIVSGVSIYYFTALLKRGVDTAASNNQADVH